MESCTVFHWARAVLSPQYLSLMPPDIDCGDVLSEIATGLRITADISTDMNSPALQGQWEDILRAQIKLIDLLSKWRVGENEDGKVSLSCVSKADKGFREAESAGSAKGDFNEDLSKVGRKESSNSYCKNENQRSVTTNEETDTNSNHLQTNVSSESFASLTKTSSDVHNEYVLPNDCSQLDLLPSLSCDIPAVNQDTVTTSSEQTDHMSMAIGNHSQLILVTSTVVNSDDKISQNKSIKKEKIGDELYMNIVLAPRKEFSEHSKEAGESKGNLTNEVRENPLDRLCQLLKINEEEVGEKKCEQFERRRKYEDNLPYKYFCSHCSFKTKRENQYLRHFKLHEKPRVLYHCNRCHFRTIRVSTLRRHELLHNEDRLLNCNQCSYKTDSLKFLSKHVQVKHSPNRPALQCCHCDFLAGSLRELRKHRQTHSPVKPKQFWGCCQCSYRTQNKGHLERHKNDAHGMVRPFLCHHCGKSFKRHDTLKQHKVTHGESGPVHSCSQCSKVCRSSTQLKEHMTVHSSQRPFLCELCGSTFKTRSIQSKHIKTMHSAVKNFPCPLCKQTFNTKSTMMRHQKTHRSEEDMNPIEVQTEVVEQFIVNTSAASKN